MQNLDQSHDSYTYFKYDIKFSEANRSQLKVKEIKDIKDELLRIDQRFNEIFCNDEYFDIYKIQNLS